MCIAIALTAVRLGANVANHTEVLELNKQTSDGKLVLCGAKVKDRVTGLFHVNTELCIVSCGYKSLNSKCIMPNGTSLIT